jgi:type VI secretion system protein ImpA
MPELPDVIDVTALLAPIAGDTPTGVNLRDDTSPGSLYMRLRDARAEARAAERAMEAEDATVALPPQWRTIRELAAEALAQHSKDLEIAAWLAEALLRSDGLRGFGAALQTMSGMVEEYWDNLFPMPDEDGVETRVAPVTSLNGRSGDGTVIQALRRVELFNRPDGAPFQFWQYEQSVSLAGVVDEARRQQRIDAGVVPFETVETEAHLAGPARFATLKQDAAAAAEAWRRLSGALDARAGSDAPPTSRVREMLDQIGSIAGRFAGADATANEAAAENQAETSPSRGEAAAAAGWAPGSGGPAGINSRADALRTLSVIAAYFRQTEPLSPLAYTLEEVVRRAGMTWPQLLEEIIPDPAARAAVLTSLGIRPPPSE